MKSRVRLRSGLLGAVTLWVGAAEGLGDVRSLWEICGRFGKIGGGVSFRMFIGFCGTWGHHWNFDWWSGNQLVENVCGWVKTNPELR